MNTIEEDDPESAGSREYEHFGQISSRHFRDLMNESVQHATTTVAQLASALPWRSIGPRNIGGRIRSLAQDPRNSGTLFAGSGSGGLWKSDNGGESWRVIDDFRPPMAPQALPIGAVAVARSDSSRVYVGTGEPPLFSNGDTSKLPGNGLYWSTDGGKIFNQLDPPSGSSEAGGIIGSTHYETIVIDPWESSRLWVASPVTGLWRGTPSGGVAGAQPQFTFDKTSATITPGDEKATDVVINFGDESAVAPSGNYTVYTAMWGKGIFRAEYDPATDAYIGGWTDITPTVADGRPNNFRRIKLAITKKRPDWLYAVMGDHDNKASRVLISEDKGANWRATSEREGDTGKQANYDLFLAVHPMDANIIITGSVELFTSLDGGERWRKSISWKVYNKGNRAFHADQHAFLFDNNDPKIIWLGNDGGISQSLDLGRTWRKRSYGIIAAQFYDVTVHPKFPWLMGGGLQDNGSWVGYGGQSWHYLYSGDGGLFVFDPNNPHQFYCSHQGKREDKSGTAIDDRLIGIIKSVITESSEPIGDLESPNYLNAMPDVPLKNGAPRHLLSITSRLTDGFDVAHFGAFVANIVGHPTKSDHVLSGRNKALYLTTNGTTFSEITSGLSLADFVTAAAYDHSDPDNRFWFATDDGEIYMTADAGSNWHNRTPTGVGSNRITAIAIHPGNPHIIAFSVAADARDTFRRPFGRVFISGNAGDETLSPAANRGEWREISGRTSTPPAAAADQFSPSLCTALVFDPGSPNAAASNQTLYAGTLTGVYVVNNVPAPVAPADILTPVWRTFNRNLPLVLISDLVISTYRDEGGTEKHILLAATYGRGIYECELGSGLSPVRLLMRNHIMEDGRRYHSDHLMTDDPRLTDAAAGKGLRSHEAMDIRIESPPVSIFWSSL